MVVGVSTARRGGRARRRVEPGRVAREVRVRQTLAAIAPEPRWKKPHRRAGRAPPGLRRRERAVRAAGVGTRTCVGISSLCRCLAAYLRRVRKRAPTCARPELLGEASFFRARSARVCRRARDASRFRPRARAKKIRAIAAHPGASPPHTGARPRGVSRCRCGQRWRRRATPRRACSFRGSRGRASTRAPPSPPPRSGRRRAGRRNRRAALTSSSSRFAPPHPPSLPRGSDDAPDRDHRLVAHHRHVPRVAIPPRAEPLTPGARALERARPPALT